MNLLTDILLFSCLLLIIANLLLSYFAKENAKKMTHFVFSQVIILVMMVYFSTKYISFMNNVIELMLAYLVICSSNVAILHLTLTSSKK